MWCGVVVCEVHVCGVVLCEVCGVVLCEVCGVVLCEVCSVVLSGVCVCCGCRRPSLCLPCWTMMLSRRPCSGSLPGLSSNCYPKRDRTRVSDKCVCAHMCVCLCASAHAPCLTGWLYGELDGESGSFPSEYVVPIASQSIGQPSQAAVEVSRTAALH